MAALVWCAICAGFQAGSARAGEVADVSAASSNRSPCQETNAEGFIRLIDLPATAFPFHFVPVQGRNREDFGGVVRCEAIQKFSSWSQVIAGQTPRMEGDYAVSSLGHGTAELFHSPRRVLVCDAVWKGQMKGYPRGCNIQVALCPSQQDSDAIQLVLEIGIDIGDLPNIGPIETALRAAARDRLQAEGIILGCLSA